MDPVVHSEGDNKYDHAIHHIDGDLSRLLKGCTIFVVLEVELGRNL